MSTLAAELEAARIKIETAVKAAQESNARLAAAFEQLQWEVEHNGNGPMSEFLPVLAALRADIEALPEPTLGLKGGVNRAEVLRLIDERMP